MWLKSSHLLSLFRYLSVRWASCLARATLQYMAAVITGGGAVCACKCVRVCKCASLWVCMCPCVQVCVRVCESVSVHVSVCASVHAHTGVCACVCVRAAEVRLKLKEIGTNSLPWGSGSEGWDEVGSMEGLWRLWNDWLQVQVKKVVCNCVISRLVRDVDKISLVPWWAGAASNIGMVFKCMTWANCRIFWKLWRAPDSS